MQKKLDSATKVDESRNYEKNLNHEKNKSIFRTFTKVIKIC